MSDNNLWNPNQNGFMKKCRTEDNIFILHTLFQKYIKIKKQKLHVAFIDLKKFFDTINRDMLRYKLIKHGITGNTYNVLKAAYTNTMYAVRTKDRPLSNFFKSEIGVKQGCNLSPTLSNIFQNDLANCFNEHCDPVDCLLYTSPSPRDA